MAKISITELAQTYSWNRDK